MQKIAMLILISIINCNIEMKSKEDKESILAVNVFYKDFDRELYQSLHCGKDLKNIIILLLNGDVFHSKNYGVNWSENKDYFNLSYQKGGFRFVYMAQNPLDINHVYFEEENGTHFETKDCGETITPILYGDKLVNYTFHPKFKERILVNHYQSCKEQKGDCKIGWFLKLSEDQGLTWRILDSDVGNFNWAKYSQYSYEASINRIFYLKFKTNINSLYYTDDYFKTSKMIFSDVYDISLNKYFIFVDTHKKFSKYVSDAYGDLYSFNAVKLDKIPKTHYKSYIIETDLKDMTYMTAIWKENELEISSLFYSDYWGSKYQTILDYLVCDYQIGGCDIYIVKSLEGVLIANVFDENIITKLQDIPENQMDTPFYIDNFENLNQKIKTMISFDYGKTWNSVRIPDVDYENKPINCRNCNLHFFISPIKKEYEQKGIVSQKSSPGIIIAQGTFGHYLDDNKSNLGVFISEDGGLNWRHILTGEYTYQMIDQGGFVVAGITNIKTNYIKISTDYGRTWSEIKISEHEVYINEFVIESLEKDHKFLVLAHLKKSGQKKGIVITVDLNDFHDRVCKYSENNLESDYQEFAPYGLTSYSKCYNGREIVYLRKKTDKRCYNQDNEPLVRVKRLCSCTEEDWHCNFGFLNVGNKCEYMTTKNVDPLTLINNYQEFKNHEKNNFCTNNKYKKNPYIKNIRSFCQGGIDHGKPEIPCGTYKFKFPPIISYAFILLIILGLLYYFKDNLNNFIPKNKLSMINNSFEMLKSKNKKEDSNDNNYGNIVNRNDDIFNNDDLFENEKEDNDNNFI